jgi:hypothetical protein
MFKRHAVSYEDLTDRWISDVHEGRKGTETLDSLTEAMGSRTEAIAGILEVTAPGHFDCPVGERIEHLTRWRSNLSARITDTYQILLEEGFSPETANANPLLIDIRAIQLGVRRATNMQHRLLADGRQSRAAPIPARVIDPDFFEPHP